MPTGRASRNDVSVPKTTVIDTSAPTRRDRPGACVKSRARKQRPIQRCQTVLTDEGGSCGAHAPWLTFGLWRRQRERAWGGVRLPTHHLQRQEPQQDHLPVLRPHRSPAEPHELLPTCSVDRLPRGCSSRLFTRRLSLAKTSGSRPSRSSSKRSPNPARLQAPSVSSWSPSSAERSTSEPSSRMRTLPVGPL